MASASSSTVIGTSNASMCANWLVDSRHTFAAIDDTRLFIPDVTGIIVGYLKENHSNFFGQEQWDSLSNKGFCGKVNPAPPLPIDIEIILQSLCPAFPEERTAEGTPVLVKDTHMLVYVPKMVGDKPLTLNSLGKIAKFFFPASDSGYRTINGDVVAELGDRSIDRACWMLMTKSVLSGSRNKSFSAQQTMIADLDKKIRDPYEVPKTLEAAVCIFSQYISSSEASKTRLFGDSPLTYTSCQEEIRSCHVVVGGFAPAGLNVNFYDYDHGNPGVAALRKF